MLPHEKLVFQLNALEKWLDKLQLHFVKQAVIIHGVGSGKLRDEVHQLLNHKPNVKSFVQQYHPWYGNGATEVFFA
jgi:dsDNA-specific endonuclease/ATPase MutS2